MIYRTFKIESGTNDWIITKASGRVFCDPDGTKRDKEFLPIFYDLHDVERYIDRVYFGEAVG